MLHDGSGDVITLLLSMLLGVVFCLFYDIFRILRIAVRCSVSSIFFQDIIFFIFTALLTFSIMLVRTYGEIRWFILIGELSGFILCRFSISRLLISISEQIIKGVRAVILVINKIIAPIKKLLSYLMSKVKSFSSNLQKKAAKISKCILKYLYGILYNKLNKQKSDKAKQTD